MRFELTEHFYSAVFKTAAINRTLPHFHNLVEYPGIEPGVPKAADLQSTASPLMLLLQFGAQGGTRTHKIWLLRPTRIPIPSPGRNFTIIEIHLQELNLRTLLYTGQSCFRNICVAYAFVRFNNGTGYGIRIRVLAVKGRCPRPLDEPSILSLRFLMNVC